MSKQHDTRRLFFLALAAILMMRSFVPVGWMPNHNQDGLFALTLCSQPGALRVVYVDEQGREVDTGQGETQSEQSCPFALACVIDLPVALTAIKTAVFAKAGSEVLRRTASIGRGLAAPPPPSHAPPAAA